MSTFEQVIASQQNLFDSVGFERFERRGHAFEHVADVVLRHEVDDPIETKTRGRASIAFCDGVKPLQTRLDVVSRHLDGDCASVAEVNVEVVPLLRSTPEVYSLDAAA